MIYTGSSGAHHHISDIRIDINTTVKLCTYTPGLTYNMHCMSLCAQQGNSPVFHHSLALQMFVAVFGRFLIQPTINLIVAHGKGLLYFLSNKTQLHT